MEFKKLIPELSVFDIDQTREFYKGLGFTVEYERAADKFIFMSFEGSQFMFEEIHEDGWNIGHLEYPLGRGINFSIACEDVEQLYAHFQERDIALYRKLTKNLYETQGGILEEQAEFLIQDPNGYLLRFTN